MSTAKERQTKRRAKLRKNPHLYKTYLEKDRSRKKFALKEAKSKMTVKQREDFLIKE